ncbi:TrmH family RNA methyltransferase [Fodinibius sediminis]|uniref:tRNA (guanosine(18)-2'-O)-methyltransferase n=1 Tax=Fodinibius sediminis TaxID=1214077 RepID=A0A521E2K3_9BACT|nr:RNA methyltransferase [Fodinibius sediminis]SMO78207.1 tRNA (guanosine-2'-O-)-methyltransferase [Fodinibius sediminis]
MDNALKGAVTGHLLQFITEDRRRRINEVLDQRSRFLSVVLEDLYQPHNASAVLRSCDCFGVQDVHIIENENRFNPSKGVTIGSDQWLSLHKYNASGDGENTRRCYRQLREQGYRLVATTPHEDDVTIDQVPLDQKTALVFGSELTGLSDVALEEADAYARIPMVGFSESFNISVSAALCLYELSTRLRREGTGWELTEDEKRDLRLEWVRKSVRAADKIEERFLAERQSSVDN